MIKPILQPFAALRPVPEYAQIVAAPPYDILSTAEARELAKDNPWSFLHISRPEIDKFLGAMVINDYTRGIFITSSSFTNGAKNTAFQKNIDFTKQIALQQLIDYKLKKIQITKFNIKSDNTASATLP